MIKHRNKVKISRDDQIFHAVVGFFLTIITLAVLYPLIYIVSASFSSGEAVSSGRVILWPVDFSLEGYKAVFKDPRVFTGYQNSIIYTVLGTAINIFMTVIAAYPLSRSDLPGRKAVLFIFTFTMMFSGGMIPSYILLRDLRMLNSVWAMVVPGAISVYNMIITRTYFQNNIPPDLLEAARIDGCSNTTFFIKIVMPLSKAIIAVLVLFYAVGHWNAYFNAFLYLHEQSKYPLQIFLREILVANNIDPSLISDPALMEVRIGLAELLKYSLIIVATVPILCIYPFIQKYFVKGVMIGSLKG